MNIYHLSCSWVNDQDKNEVWTDGVEDYLTYAKKLVQEYKDVINSTSGTSTGVEAVNGSVFGRLGGTFSAAAATAPASTAAAPSGAFNFAAAPASGGFSGFSTGIAPTTASPANDDGDEDAAPEEETGPSVQLGDSNVDILHSTRVNLMSQDSGKWKDKGPGILTIRRMKNAPESSPFLVFTNDVGAIILNAGLYKGIKYTIPEKRQACFMMPLTSKRTPDSPEESGLHLFKCAGVDAQKQLTGKISELTAKE
jgi:nuclear pore complex protein Nup50